MSGNPGCSVPFILPLLPPSKPTPTPSIPTGAGLNSQRRLVHVDHLVILQCRVRARLAEEESELHQPHAVERRLVVRGAEHPEKCLRGHLSR